MNELSFKTNADESVTLELTRAEFDTIICALHAFVDDRCTAREGGEERALVERLRRSASLRSEGRLTA